METETEREGAPSRRTVFREEVRGAIREAIFSGQLKPGDKVLETYWSRALSVSQGPVREAIRDLEAMGLVETVPFKGSRVRTLTRKDLMDNYSVRICLESKSIRDVAAGLDDAALSALSARLGEILARMDECARRGDLRAFTDEDTAFHRAILDATGNLVLLRLWELCNLRNWFLISSLKDAGILGQLQAEHQRICRALRDRDAEGAVSTLENHLTGLMEGYMRELPPPPEQR